MCAIGGAIRAYGFRSVRQGGGVVVAAWIVGGGCVALYDVDDLRFDPPREEPLGGTDHAGGRGGDIGTGGIGGIDPTGTGGGGASACSLEMLGQTGLCADGEKCTVVDTVTGEVGCAVAGTKGSWERCTDDSDCRDGLWCAATRNVCKPFCQNESDCAAFDGECVPTLNDGGTIPGVKTCISMCEPVTASPCAVEAGVTCVFTDTNRFDCAESQGTMRDGDCTDQADCAASLTCIFVQAGMCLPWCTPVGAASTNCASGCVSLSPEIFYMGEQYGICY